MIQYSKIEMTNIEVKTNITENKSPSNCSWQHVLLVQHKQTLCQYNKDNMHDLHEKMFNTQAHTCNISTQQHTS